MRNSIMKNSIFEDFFDDIEIENDEVEDISNISYSQNCYFKFIYYPRFYLGSFKKNLFDVYIIYKKLKTCVDLLSFTKDVDIKIFASETYNEQTIKEKIEIKPTQNKRYVYEFFRKDIDPKLSLSYHVEIIINFKFNKVSYARFVRDMNNLFLNIKYLDIVYTFELGNIENDEKCPNIPFLENISNKMMEDYFKCFCPDVDVDDNSKDIIYNKYFTKFGKIINKFINDSDFDIVLKQIERKKYTDKETSIPDCIFIHLYYNIPRGQKYQKQDVYVDMRKKLFDFIPRILAVNFNICFLITSSKPFIGDFVDSGETQETKNLTKGYLEHINNMASRTRRNISTFYVFKTLDYSNSKFYMAFLNKDGKLLNGKIEFYRDMRWAYLFQPIQHGPYYFQP